METNRHYEIATNNQVNKYHKTAHTQNNLRIRTSDEQSQSLMQRIKAGMIEFWYGWIWNGSEYR